MILSTSCVTTSVRSEWEGTLDCRATVKPEFRMRGEPSCSAAYLLGLLAMIKCSICSYQCDNWYVSNWRLACHMYFWLGKCALELARRPSHVALAWHTAGSSIPFWVTMLNALWGLHAHLVIVYKQVMISLNRSWPTRVSTMERLTLTHIRKWN